MKTNENIKETGNVLICVLGAILIVSFIGANVLRSSTTRFNVASTQVRAWKEALSTAESGGDIAFAELRKHQAGLAFYKAIFQGSFGQVTTLTVIRDRLIGIFFGLIVFGIVEHVLWPVSATERCAGPWPSYCACWRSWPAREAAPPH